MAKIIDRIEVCEDCMVLAETGELHGTDDATRAKVSAALDAVAKRGYLVSDFDSDTGDGRVEFSWRACECCRSPLGGARYRMSILSR